MEKQTDKVFKPKDIVALVSIVSFVVFAMYSGMNMLPSAIMLILGYYFARREEGVDRGK